MKWSGLTICSAARGQAFSELCDRIFAGRVCVALDHRSDEFLTHFNCGSLVLSDSAYQDLLLAADRVEVPSAVLGDQRDRKGPVFCANIEDRSSVALANQAVHLLIFLGKLLAFQFVVVIVAG